MLNSIVGQFGHPRGLLGRLAGMVMSLKNRERIAWVISLLNVQPDDSVLEIGFGPGISIQQVAAIAVQGFIAGIDHSALMVEQARKYNAAAIRAGLVELRHGSVEVLPYGDAMFDKAFAINSLLFWPQPVENLKEIKRVLKPGGRVAIAHQPPMTRDEGAAQAAAETLTSQLTAAGFRQVSVVLHPMKPVTTVCAIGVREDTA